MRFCQYIVLLSAVGIAACASDPTPAPATPLNAETSPAEYGEQTAVVVGKAFQAQLPAAWSLVTQSGTCDGHDICIEKDGARIEVYVEVYGRSFTGLINDIQSHLGTPNTPLRVLPLSDPDFGLAVTFGDNDYSGVAVLRQMNNGSNDALVMATWPTKASAENTLALTLEFARTVQSRGLSPAAPKADEAVPAQPAEEVK